MDQETLLICRPARTLAKPRCRRIFTESEVLRSESRRYSDGPDLRKRRYPDARRWRFHTLVWGASRGISKLSQSGHRLSDQELLLMESSSRSKIECPTWLGTLGSLRQTKPASSRKGIVTAMLVHSQSESFPEYRFPVKRPSFCCRNGYTHLPGRFSQREFL